MTPRRIRLSTSPELEQALLSQFGPEQAERVLLEMMNEPPLTVRCNPLKTDRRQVLGRREAG